MIVMYSFHLLPFSQLSSFRITDISNNKTVFSSFYRRIESPFGPITNFIGRTIGLRVNLEFVFYYYECCCTPFYMCVCVFASLIPCVSTLQTHVYFFNENKIGRDIPQQRCNKHSHTFAQKGKERKIVLNYNRLRLGIYNVLLFAFFAKHSFFFTRNQSV